jgi:signal transduction histidine kinase
LEIFVIFGLLNRPLLRCLALVGVLLLGCLAGAGAAQAQDHIVARGWLEDPTGQLSWAQAQQRATQPFKATLNRGYGTAAVWLRLRIDPQLQPHTDRASAPTSDGLVLRIRPVYLDEVEVFDPLAPGGRAGVVGDRHHPRLDALPGADFLLPIARGDAPRDIWLRLTSTSTRQIHVEVLARGALDALTMRQNLLSSFYIGMVLILLGLGLVKLLVHGETLMGFFALMQLTTFFYALGALGMLRVFWPLAWPAETLNLLGSVFSVLVVGGGLPFHIRFLRELQPPAWAMGLLHAMMAWVGLNLVLLAFGQELWALQNNMWIILLAPPLCWVCVLTGRAFTTADGAARPALNRGVLLTFYTGFVVILIVSASSALGWGQASEWTIYMSLSHGLVTSVLLMVMLQYREHVLNQKRQQARVLLEKTTLQVAHERHLREEQEKLLTMLAHEIKTPLATMHFRLDGQSKNGREIRQAMRDMNDVIDRCMQTLQLGDGQLTLRIQMADLVDLLQDAVPVCSQPERVRVHLPPSLPLETDTQLLFIVLSNLLENACKYSAPETPIELHCSVAEGGLLAPVARLELSNLPGQSGWPDAQCIFDKYYRAPRAKRQSGTGLGLYLVQSLTQTLGGRIAYQPDDQVIRFVLTLPLPLRA